jgi:ammonia channel protein AmtB
MLIIINFITPVRVSQADELAGLDNAIHGEKAYDEGAL